MPWNPFPKSYQCSILAGRNRGWEDWCSATPATEVCLVSHCTRLVPELTSSHSRTQCFLFLADKNWCSSCASFSPFILRRSFCIYSLCPPLPPFPPFSSARSHWLCISPSFFQWARMSDMALSGCIYPPPLLSLIPPPSFAHCSLLSQGGGGGGRGGRFSPPSLPLLFFVLYVTAAKMRTNIWTKQGTWKFAWLSLLFADKITALHNTNITHKLKHMRG